MKRQFLPTSDIFATPETGSGADGVHSAKPESLCNRNPVQISAGVPSKGGLATLAFDCDSQQINNIIIVKYKCGPAQSAGESKGMTLLTRLGDGLSPKLHGYRSR
jgi:hypothetical protein